MFYLLLSLKIVKMLFCLALPKEENWVLLKKRFSLVRMYYYAERPVTRIGRKKIQRETEERRYRPDLFYRILSTEAIVSSERDCHRIYIRLSCPLNKTLTSRATFEVTVGCHTMNIKFP